VGVFVSVQLAFAIALAKVEAFDQGGITVHEKPHYLKAQEPACI
jgi:hypothetical protein